MYCVGHIIKDDNTNEHNDREGENRHKFCRFYILGFR